MVEPSHDNLVTVPPQPSLSTTSHLSTSNQAQFNHHGGDGGRQSHNRTTTMESVISGSAGSSGSSSSTAPRSGPVIVNSRADDHSILANVFINSNRGISTAAGASSNTDEFNTSSSLEVSTTSSTPSTISLSLPRPDHQRSSNLYVDTPFPHRPTPRRPPAPSASHLNLRSTSPLVGRSQSPSALLSSTFTLHSTSSSNLLLSSCSSSSSQHHTSTLPSVHRTHIKRSFVNPSCHNVNSNTNSNINKSTTSNNNNSDRHHHRNSNSNKLSSSSFSFSSTKSRNVINSGGVIIHTQPTPLSFIKGGQLGGSGGVGGKSFSKASSKHLLGAADPFTDISKSVGDLRSSGRRFLGNAPLSDGIQTSSGGSRANFLGSAGLSESIICGRCGRCRCEACTTPKPPPSAWLCSGKCLCSLASAVDCLSCACCVKAALYHCGAEDESSHRPGDTLGLRTRGQSFSGTCSDDDASSTATKEMPSCWRSRCALWSCLILGAIPLPCLLCYFPLTALRRLLEKGYQRCTSHGCRCPPPAAPHTSPSVPQPLALLAQPAPHFNTSSFPPQSTPPPPPLLPPAPELRPSPPSLLL